VPIQLAQCRFPGLAISNAKIENTFQIKYTETILSNSTQKLMWFVITKKVTEVLNDEFTTSFIVIIGTLSSPMLPCLSGQNAQPSALLLCNT